MVRCQLCDLQSQLFVLLYFFTGILSEYLGCACYACDKIIVLINKYKVRFI